MKKFNFQLTVLLLAFSITFASCKKDDEVTANNELTFNGKTLALKKGFNESHGGPYQYIVLTKDEITFDQQRFSYSAESDGVELHLYREIGKEDLVGTYPQATDYEQNNTTYRVRIVIDGIETMSSDTDTGSVVVTKSGTTYEVNCNYTIGGKALKIYYKGTLDYANMFNPGK